MVGAAHNKLYSYYTTYERMDVLFNNTLPIRRRTPNTINVFIDTQDALHYLGRNHYAKYNPSEVLAVLLNMAGHYRNYFINRGYLTRIYFINASEVASDMYLSRIDPGYGNKRKETQPELSNVYNNVRVIAQYLPNIHYVESAYDFSTTVLHHCINESKYHPKAEYNLCISRDALAVSIISHYRDMLVLRPTKKVDKDVSYLMDYNNALYAVYYKDHGNGIEDLHITMYSILAGLCGCSNRSVSRILSTAAAVTLLKKAQDELLTLTNGCVTLASPEVIYRVLSSINNSIDYTVIRQREHMFNLKYILLEYSSNPETIDYFRCVNLVNNQELYQLNQVYFKQTKLVVDWLIR